LKRGYRVGFICIRHFTVSSGSAVALSGGAPVRYPQAT
jgi:hypothetical protein